MILRGGLCGLGLLAAAGHALAEAVSAAPEAVEVTIYRADTTPEGYALAGGLGMITETRTVEVAGGETRIRFRGVADGIAPQSAKIEGLPEAVVEQDFDYDLLSPGSLIAKSLGSHVKVSRTNRATGEVSEQDATLVSGPDGVVLSIDGGVEAFKCSGGPEKLVYENVPKGLADKPTLSVRTPPLAAGRYRVRLSYLATGMDWSANYVARIRPDRRTLDLLGWITLVNRGSITFADAPTQVVAGKWNRVGDGPEGPPPEIVTVQLRCWPQPGVPAVASVRAVNNDQIRLEGTTRVEELIVTGSRIPAPNLARMSELGDYKLYTLPGRTTVAAQQSKQVAMIDQHGVPFERIYRFEVDAQALYGLDEPAMMAATVLLRVQNKASEGLGKPLPSGSVSVMEQGPAGGEVFAGQDRVEDIPVGSPFELELGRAADVAVTPRVLSREAVDDRVKSRVQISVRNGKPVPVRFQLRHLIAWRNFKVVEEPMRHETDAGRPQWSIALKPGETRTFTYTVQEGG